MAMEETETYYVAPKSVDVAIDFDNLTASWNVNNSEVRKNCCIYESRNFRDQRPACLNYNSFHEDSTKEPNSKFLNRETIANELERVIFRRFTWSLKSGPAFYPGFFPANLFFHFKRFLITFDWLKKNPIESRPRLK